MKTKLNTIIQAGHLVRYHTAETSRNPTLSEHIYGVLTILDYIYCGKPPLEVFRSALYHDLAEYHTGDLPHPFKKAANGTLKGELEKAEIGYLASVGLKLDKLSNLDKTLVKAADILEMGYFAAREIRMGNTYAYDILEKVSCVVRTLLDTIPHEYVKCSRRIESVMDDINYEIKTGRNLNASE